MEQRVSMINYIRGELAEICESYVVVDHDGMGYEVFVPQTVFGMLPAVGQEVKLFTYLQVKEDGMALFGFTRKEDLKVFKLLITVNGIGPKGALGILSAISTDELRFAILANDAKAISKAPGIGAKTASKLILELKDKFSLEDAFESSFAQNPSGQMSLLDPQGMEGIKEEAVQALVALGYSASEALKAVKGVAIIQGMTAEDVIKAGLKRV